MSLVALRPRLTRPVSGPMSLDTTHPLARGLVGAWGVHHHGRGKVFDYVTRKPLAVANANNTTSFRYADGFRFRKNATQATADQDVGVITPTITRTNLSFTMVQHLSLYDTGNAYRAYGSLGAIGDPTYLTYNTGGSGGQAQLWWGHAGGTTTSITAVNTRGVGRSSVVGVSHRFGVGAGGVRAFVDGRYISNGTSHTGSATYNYNRLALGGLTYNGGNTSGRESQNGVALFLFWDRALSDAEMAQITANPYQILVAAQGTGLRLVLNYGVSLLSVDGDNAIFQGQTGVVILPSPGTSFAAAGNRVTLDQGGLRLNQLVTAESSTSITITADLSGLTLPGSATLTVHRPR